MSTDLPYRSACAYIRGSAAGIHLQVSLLVQARRIAAFCTANHHILTCTVVEAAAAHGGPELERLLDLATSSAHPFDQFIVSSASRLSRDPAMVQDIKERLSAAGVDLVVLEAAKPAAAMPMSAEIL